MKRKLCGTSYDELHNFIDKKGFNPDLASKILIGCYRKGTKHPGDISNIPRKLKTILSSEFINGTILPHESQVSADGTMKYLFRNQAGLEFETVYLPEKNRKTVCISTQSGCRMGCRLCVTGRYGFNGNLSAGDMVNQVISIPESGSVTHVVFMGMGEPMDNIQEVIKACRIFTSEWGLTLSCRNITVSTVGILPAILEFLGNSNCNLTLSLHSPFPEERKELIPVENKYPVKEIIENLKSFPLGKKRRISVAYIMIRDFNDTDDHLEELIRLLKGTSIRVNLLPFHKVNDEEASSSHESRMQYFKHNLVLSGISASIRKSRGEDISAACGLLASDLMKNN